MFHPRIHGVRHCMATTITLLLFHPSDLVLCDHRAINSISIWEEASARTLKKVLDVDGRESQFKS